MMSDPGCPPFHELLQAVAPLPPDDKERVLDHLERCFTCQAVLGIIPPAGTKIAPAVHGDAIPAQPARRLSVLPKPIYAIPLMVIVFWCWTPERILNAEQLLRRGVLAERAFPPPTANRVRARFVSVGPGESFSVIRDRRSTGAPEELSGATGSQALVNAFAASPFARQTLLSIEAVLSFRRSYPKGSDGRVSLHAREGRCTVTLQFEGGMPQEVELTLEVETHRVIREVLVFPGIGRVEIEDLTDETSNVVIPTPPTREELELAELNARLVVARGDAREPRTAMGCTGETERKPFRLTRWLDRTFADTRMRESFGPALLQSLDTLCERLAVLTELSERYLDPHTQLPKTTRPLLQELVGLHYQRLRRELNTSKALVSALSQTATVAFDAHETPALLLSRAPAAFARVRAFDRAVRDIAASDDLGSDERQRLQEEFAALWRALYGPPPRDGDGAR
jgi:hypothetical protein